MPINAKNGVYKQKEFDIYVLWKFLPPQFGRMKKNELTALGFTDPLISKIIKIKNQTEFSKYFYIKDLGTLTDWNNKIKKENITSPLLGTNFEKQLSSINQKIILPNINKLADKISEQRRMIYFLKKENSLLKNKIKPRVSSKKEGVVNSNMMAKPEIIPPVKPPTSSPEQRSAKTFFQKFKDLF